MVLVIPLAFVGDFYPEYTVGSVTLTMRIWTSDENYSIEEFQKVYPGIKVQRENFGVQLYQSSKLRYQRAQTYQVCVFVPQYTDLGAFQLINEWLDRETFVKLYRESALVRCNLWFLVIALVWQAGGKFLTVKMVIGTLISPTPAAPGSF